MLLSHTRFLCYTLPFERYSEYAAILIYVKNACDSGYGECAYYLSLAQFLTQRDDDLQKQCLKLGNR